ncbi:hypothetical protein BpHYR1_043826 [Brachionus plicatilis]|uniref:Uncharacterized protein n=1 Tax=Brachionus plicatilis TaxID=10195 RepID=A0A3M7RWQ6_BRAPC|nr:hypothetical protein BpHYR1_043826 [Brachionus plicatilis]
MTNVRTDMHLKTQDLVNNAQPIGLESNGAKTKPVTASEKSWTTFPMQNVCPQVPTRILMPSKTKLIQYKNTFTEISAMTNKYH